jgi:transposase-like protein
LNTRKKYSKEFKLDAVSLVVDQKYSQSEAAKNLGINPNLLGRWIRESQAATPSPHGNRRSFCSKSYSAYAPHAGAMDGLSAQYLQCQGR